MEPHALGIQNFRQLLMFYVAKPLEDKQMQILGCCSGGQMCVCVCDRERQHSEEVTG